MFLSPPFLWSLLGLLLISAEMVIPGFVIFFLAFLIVIITRIISRFYVTKRFITLKKEFKHWQGIREEAMKHPDREKGKRLASKIGYPTR